MRKLLSIVQSLLVCATIPSCLMNREQKSAFVGVLINMNMPDSCTGKMFALQNDTLLICHQNDVVVHRQSIESTVYNKKALKNGRFEISDDSTTIESRRILHRYYIHRRGRN